MDYLNAPNVITTVLIRGKEEQESRDGNVIIEAEVRVMRRLAVNMDGNHMEGESRNAGSL